MCSGMACSELADGKSKKSSTQSNGSAAQNRLEAGIRRHHVTNVSQEHTACVRACYLFAQAGRTIAALVKIVSTTWEVAESGRHKSANEEVQETLLSPKMCYVDGKPHDENRETDVCSKTG